MSVCITSNESSLALIYLGVEISKKSWKGVRSLIIQPLVLLFINI